MIWKQTFLLFAASALLLCACGKQARYEVEYQGQTYTVDAENHCIQYEGTAYPYEQSASGSHTSLVILYPDGSTWYQGKDEGMVRNGWSENYNPASGASGDTLAEVLAASPAGRAKPAEPAFLLLTLLGILQAIWPRMAWTLSKGWQFKNAEPSDAALFLGRIAGICAAAAGILLCFL